MKKSIGFALVVLVTAAVAANAQGSPKVAVSALSSQTVSCNSTITLPLVTPATGGAGFLGDEQGAWAKYAVKTLARPLGLKVKLVIGDTPVEQGPAPAQAPGAEVRRRQNRRRHPRSVDLGRGGRFDEDVLPGRNRGTFRRPRPTPI